MSVKRLDKGFVLRYCDVFSGGESSHLRFDIYEVPIASRQTSVGNVDRRVLEGARSSLVFESSGNRV